MTYLRENEIVPPDYTAPDRAPVCDSCDSEMLLVLFSKTISEEGIEGSYTYECRHCRSVSKLRRSEGVDAGMLSL